MIHEIRRASDLATRDADGRTGGLLTQHAAGERMKRATEAVLIHRVSEAEDEAVRATADAQNAEDRGDFISAADAYVWAAECRQCAASIRAAIKRGTVLWTEGEDEAPRSSWLAEPPA